ncbi:MAG: FG-GAP-like repeat-containing protein [Myxococcales bacterium]
MRPHSSLLALTTGALLLAGCLQTVCPPERTLCTLPDGVSFCADTTTDRSHCGGCGVVCGLGEVCSEGHCALACRSGLVLCGERCVDPASDRAHCGATGDCQGTNAGTACGAGYLCTQGTCAVSCLEGQVHCGDRCVDPSTDRAHCGAAGDCQGTNAGTVCGASQVCEAGACVASCLEGQVSCGGACTDPDSDPRYCGASGDCQGANAGAQCGPGQACVAGRCALTCAAGDAIVCGGRCVNPATDDSHCGRCGIPCIPGVTSCSNGTCVAAKCMGRLEYSDVLSDTTASGSFIQLADLNGDGASDLLSHNAGSDLGAFLSTRDGTFTALKGAMPVGQEHVDSVVAADLDGNGVVDLVVAYRGLLSVMLGDGAGKFQPEGDYPTGLGHFLIAVGDFTADGMPDVALVTPNATTLRVLPNLGGGVLGPATELTVPQCAHTLLAGDFSGDGVDDLAILTGPDNSPYACDAPKVTVLLTKADGTFAPAVEYPLVSTGRVSSMLAGDLDGEGSLDLLVTQGSDVVALLNDGTGVFGPLKSSDGSGGSAALADFDGDGTLDLAAANGYEVSVFFGAGNGTFGAQTDYLASHPIALVAVDANLDGNPDIAFLGDPSIGSALGVLLNVGEGRFLSRSFQRVPADTLQPGDFDGDGQLEFAAASQSEGATIVDGLGGTLSYSGLEMGAAARALVVGAEDLDGDGALDVVVLDAAHDQAIVFGNRGDGTFSARAKYPTGIEPIGGAVSDLDGDGHPDLVYASRDSETLSVQLNAGDGALLPPVDFPLGGKPLSLVAVDVLPDGRLDVVLTLQDSSFVTVLLNDGTGYFGAMAAYEVGARALVTVGDLNGDALPDLAVASSGDRSVRVLFNDGAAGFIAGAEFAAQLPISALALGDMNGDGSLDLLVQHYSSSVGILLNDGRGALLPERRYGTGGSSLAVFDLNRDGRLDVLTGGETLLAHCF